MLRIAFIIAVIVFIGFVAHKISLFQKVKVESIDKGHNDERFFKSTAISIALIFMIGVAIHQYINSQVILKTLQITPNETTCEKAGRGNPLRRARYSQLSQGNNPCVFCFGQEPFGRTSAGPKFSRQNYCRRCVTVAMNSRS